ncbi:unnamed protein product, partial [marine sediment metagenome]
MLGHVRAKTTRFNLIYYKDEKLPQLLCKSGLPSGDYDDLIKDHIKIMIHAIMSESRGRENPKMVIERIKK